MATVVNHPEKYDSRWVLFAILGITLGLLPVFTSLIIARLPL